MPESHQKPNDLTETYYREIFENAVMGIYRSTSDGKHLHANPALAKIYGYETVEALINEMTDIRSQLYVDPTRRKTFITLLRKTGHISNFESQIRQKNGTLIWISENARIFKDEQGAIQYIVGTVKDITGRKEIEQHLYTYQNELRTLASKLALAEERERRRISTELHDSIGQSLALTKMRLASYRNSFDSSAEVKPVDEIIHLVDEVIDQTRSLIFDISPPVLYEMGLVAALEWLAERMADRHQLPMTLEKTCELPAIPQDLSVIAFQAVRELIINVVKHAKASLCNIRLSCMQQHFQIAVEDDGIGFQRKESELQTQEDKFGLFSIHERLRHVGGVMEIYSNKDDGSSIRLTLPLTIQNTGAQV